MQAERWTEEEEELREPPRVGAGELCRRIQEQVQALQESVPADLEPTLSLLCSLYHEFFQAIKEGIVAGESNAASVVFDTTIQPGPWWISLFNEILFDGGGGDVGTLLGWLATLRQSLFANETTIQLNRYHFDCLIYADKLAPVSGFEASLSHDVQFRLGKVLILYDVTMGYEALALDSLERLLDKLAMQSNKVVLTHDLITKYFDKKSKSEHVTPSGDEDLEDAASPKEMDEMLAAFLGGHTDAQNALQASVGPVGSSDNNVAMNHDEALVIVESNFKTIVDWLDSSRLRSKGTLLSNRVLMRDYQLVCGEAESHELSVNEHSTPISLVSAPYDFPKLSVPHLRQVASPRSSASIPDIEQYLSEPGTRYGGHCILHQLANVLVGVEQSQPPKMSFGESDDELTMDPQELASNDLIYLEGIDGTVDHLAGELAESFCIRLLCRLFSLLVVHREWIWSLIGSEGWGAEDHDVELTTFQQLLMNQLAIALYTPILGSSRQSAKEKSKGKKGVFRKILQRVSIFLAEPLVERISLCLAPKEGTKDILDIISIGYDETLSGLRMRIMQDYGDMVATTWRVFAPLPQATPLWSDSYNPDDLLLNFGILNSMPTDISASEGGYLHPVLPPSTTYHWMIDPTSCGIQSLLLDSVQGLVLSLMYLNCPCILDDKEKLDAQAAASYLLKILEEYQYIHKIMRHKLLKLLISVAYALPCLRSCILPILPSVMKRSITEKLNTGAQWSLPIRESIRDAVGSGEDCQVTESHFDLIESGPDPSRGCLWDGGWLVDAIPSPYYSSFRLHKGKTPPAILPQVYNTSEQQFKEQLTNATKSDNNISVVISSALSSGIMMNDINELANEVDNELVGSPQTIQGQTTSNVDHVTNEQTPSLTKFTANTLLESLTNQQCSRWDLDWLVADILIPVAPEPSSIAAWKSSGRGSFKSAINKLGLGISQGAPLGDELEALSLFSSNHYRTRVWPSEAPYEFGRGNKGGGDAGEFESQVQQLPNVVPHWHTWGYLERHLMLLGAFQLRLPPEVTENINELSSARFMSNWYLNHDRIHLTVFSNLMELVCLELIKDDQNDYAIDLKHALIALRLPVIAASLMFVNRMAHFLISIPSLIAIPRRAILEIDTLRCMNIGVRSTMEWLSVRNDMEWRSAAIRQEISLDRTVRFESLGVNHRAVPAAVVMNHHDGDYGVYLFGESMCAVQLCLPFLRSLFIYLMFYKLKAKSSGIYEFDMLASASSATVSETLRLWMLMTAEVVKVWLCLTQNRFRKLPGVPPFKPTNQRTSAGFLTLPDVASLSHVNDLMGFIRLKQGVETSGGQGDQENVLSSSLLNVVVEEINSSGPLAAWMSSMKIASPRSLQDFAFGLRFFHIDPIPESCKVAIQLEPFHQTMETEIRLAEEVLLTLVSSHQSLTPQEIQLKLELVNNILRTFLSHCGTMTKHLMPSSFGYLEPLIRLHWSSGHPSEKELDQINNAAQGKATPTDAPPADDEPMDGGMSMPQDAEKNEMAAGTIGLAAEKEVEEEEDEDLYGGMEAVMKEETTNRGSNTTDVQQEVRDSGVIKYWGMALGEAAQEVLTLAEANHPAFSRSGVEVEKLQKCAIELEGFGQLVRSACGRSTGLPSKLLPHGFVTAEV
eukprot:GHVH01006555.1.p1 GENE.GHVH01006555.1~~GHVH01006555.1.p1  ORF type:complete len:1633 (+),score=277.37 GHVH01006555.1:44-4942(+)